MSEKGKISRRGLLQAGAAAGVAAAGASSYARVIGANDRIRIGIIGPGGRVAGYHRKDDRDKGVADKPGGHLTHLCGLGKDWNIEVGAVCDVWDYRTARAAMLCEKFGGYKTQQVPRDYRKLLEMKDIDAVLIGTPDHWHAKQCIDAAAAGKNVYCEKPMTRTVEEAQQVVDAVNKAGIIFQVGVQSMSDPRWKMAYDIIKSGKIGKIVQGQTHYYRNSSVGQWRYYELMKEMTPKSVDWKMFLGTDFGLAPDMPFDRAVFAQWRCYWNFGGGMYTDLFVHQTTHLIAAMGVRYPKRVIGAGGLYLEYDGRDVPDVATVVADYDEGCQVLITASMVNDHRIEECIRGHTGTIVFPAGENYFEVVPQAVRNRPGRPGDVVAGRKIERIESGMPKGDETPAHWKNFLECIRTNNRNTNNPVELGAAAVSTVLMGTRSYRQGKVLFWDKENRKVVDADDSWAKKWEARSKARGKPEQIIGWEGGDEGSILIPPDYQKLEGPWIGDKDPADQVSSR